MEEQDIRTKHGGPFEMKAIFVDGPYHGTTRYLEGEPPLYFRVALPLGLQVNTTELVVQCVISEYFRTAQTTQNTWIYFWERTMIIK